MPDPSSPIGIFDSGIGGLSVLQALQQEMPHEHLVYLADSANAPYGERGDAYVIARSATIARWLREQHHIKALVVACNTATAAAVEALRSQHPDLPIIGVEPALKPAALASRTHRIGVIATQGTVNSARFAQLQRRHGENVQFVVRACNGLARAIEDSTSPDLPAADSARAIEALCRQHLGAMGPFGPQPGQIDTLVLGCTHYVFVADVLRAIVGADVQLLDTGAPVARRTRELLAAAQALAPAGATQRVELFTTGDVAALAQAARTWLQLPASACAQARIADAAQATTA
ncbi:MAG: glutamate racemase [Comamonas sp.]